MKQSKNTLLTLAIALTCLSIVASTAFVEPANAAIKYGYKEGQKYQFLVEMYSEVKTDEGSTKSSFSSPMIVKIKDIDEATGGYDLKIELTIVGPYGIFGGGSLISKETIEGNRLFEYYHYDSPPSPNLFTSTDWDEREDEWDDFIEYIDNRPGTTVKVDDAKNGAFKLEVELDVDDSESNIDYDNDGDRDGYTGWMKLYLEYDQNGVLKSYTYQVYKEFNPRNSQNLTYKMSLGGPSLISWDIIMYTIVGVVCFVVALILGYFVGKRKAPKVPPPPSGETLQQSV